jgi:RNA polymerase sigma factor (sigma-70 family)
VDFLSIEALPEGVLGQRSPLEVAIAIDRLLEELAAENPQRCSVVEMKFFGGLTTEEVAEVLKVTPRTVEREWRKAKAWLNRALNKGVTNEA